MLKLQALTQLCKYEESLLLLSELLVGVGLPQISSEGEKHVDTHWVSGDCVDGLKSRI